MDLDCKFKVTFAEHCGRMLIANNDFQEGEEIFVDYPAGLGPDNSSVPVCLVCYSRLKGKELVPCKYCGWPLCSNYCNEKQGWHARECELFQRNYTRLRNSGRNFLV